MEDLERELLSFPINCEKGSGIAAAADLTIYLVSIGESEAYEPQES